jgi:calcineurin-like phosphoesterase family protein
MATFFTSDWHLNDSRIEILDRPFQSVEGMNEHIIAQHNRLVAPDDTVYVLGDVIKASSDEDLSILKRFNGHLVLIRGNQDVLSGQAYARYFDRIVDEGDGMELDVRDVRCWLTHYPTRSRSDVDLNLVGHIHGGWKVQKGMLNVGVDVHHFRPVSEDQVAFYLTAIKDVYDDDMWVADHVANVAHVGRGKPGTYFAPSTD